jgi:hypothetical protein
MAMPFGIGFLDTRGRPVCPPWFLGIAYTRGRWNLLEDWTVGLQIND